MEKIPYAKKEKKIPLSCDNPLSHKPISTSVSSPHSQKDLEKGRPLTSEGLGKASGIPKDSGSPISPKQSDTSQALEPVVVPHISCNIPPVLSEDFAELAKLSKEQLQTLPLTRADLNTILRLQNEKSTPKVIPTKEFIWKRPTVEADYEALLELDRWQLAKLPLTLQDRQRLIELAKKKDIVFPKDSSPIPTSPDKISRPPYVAKYDSPNTYLRELIHWIDKNLEKKS